MLKAKDDNREIIPTADLRTQEEWLRQEIRADRTIMTNLLQWGVGILAAVEVNLFYLRQEIYKRLLDHNLIKAGELLPFGRWLIGTLFVAMLAYFFTNYMRRIVKRHQYHRTQLQKVARLYSGIVEDTPIGGRLGRLHYYLFFAFPIFDIFVYALFYAGEKITIHIPW